MGTNEGFGKLPAGTVDTLLKPENKDQLVDILTYHVLGQEVPSKALKYFQRVPTVEGKNLHIYKNFRGVFVSPDSQRRNSELRLVVSQVHPVLAIFTESDIAKRRSAFCSVVGQQLFLGPFRS